MKKIIVLFALLLGSIISIAQPVTQRGTTSVTVQDARLFAQYNFRPPVFPDTTSANTQIGLDSCGALIFSRDINAYYYRACSPKRWVRVASGGATADSAYLSYRPLTDSTFLLCRVGGTRCDTIKINGKGATEAWLIGGNINPIPPYIGTIDTKEVDVITNNVVRMRIAGNGINRSAAARNRYLMIDTLTRYLFYGDEAGSAVSLSQGFGIANSPNPITSIGTIATDTSVSGLSGKYLRIVDGWNLKGNSGTNSTTDFLGTTDNQDLVFKRNNSSVGIYRNNRNQSIGGGATVGSITGTDNLAFGNSDMSTITSGSYNMQFNNSGTTLTTGSDNIFFGTLTGYNTTTGTGNLYMGRASGINYFLSSARTGNYNVMLGHQTGQSYTGITTGHNNTFLGTASGNNFATTSSNNVLVGDSVEYQDGVFPGTTQSIGNRNIIIGSRINSPDRLASNQLDIGNLIFGINLDGTYRTISSGKIGIGVTTPLDKFHVAGTARVTDTLKLTGLQSKTDTTANKPLAIDASGNVVKMSNWVSGGGGGRVTSIAQGYGITNSPNPIVATGTVTIDTSVSGLSGKYLRLTDSSLMLSPYLRKLDTASLSNRINLKVNIADTSSMLLPYLRKVDTTNRFVNNVTKKNDSTITVFKGSTSTDIVLPRGSAGSSGTVTSITQGYGMVNSPNPIVAIGTVTVDTSTGGLSGKYLRIVDTTNKFVNNVTKINDTAIRVWKGTTSSVISLAKDIIYTQSPIMSKVSNDSNIIYFNADTANVWRGGGSGTVTSITQGYGMVNSPNPIITTGTVTVDTATLSGKYLRITDTTNKWIYGSGTATRVPYWSANRTLTSSPNMIWNTSDSSLGVSNFYTGTAGSTQFDINSTATSLPASLGIWRRQINGAYTYLKEDEQGNAQHKWAFVRRDGFNQTRAFYQANSSIMNINLGWESPNSSNYDGSTLLINPKINISNALNSGTIIRGIYYNPTLTSLTNTKHIAFESASGDVVMKGLKKSSSTTDSIAIWIDDTLSKAPYPSVTGFVPYTGATSNLNMGTKNVTANAYFNGFTSMVAAGTTITLTVDSTPVHLVSGSGGQTFQLPNATTLSNGNIFSFNNNQSSGSISVNNNSGTLVKAVGSGGYMTLELTSNTTSAGTWDAHFQTPSNVSWSTNTFDYGGSITSAQWNGTTVAYNRGGTGQSSAFTQGGVAFGSTTTALGTTAAGTSGQVLTSAGTGTPTWSTVITPSDTSVFLRKTDSTIYYTKYRSDTSRTNIYTAINGKQPAGSYITTSDTSVFQRKSISSYTMLANNTNATGNATAQTFRDTAGTYAGTITWTGTAPTTQTINAYQWQQTGKMVRLQLFGYYTNAGTACTAVSLTIPADCPAPDISMFTSGALAILYQGIGGLGLSNTSLTTTINAYIRRNAANNGNELFITAASNNYRRYQIDITYRAQ